MTRPELRAWAEAEIENSGYGSLNPIQEAVLKALDELDTAEAEIRTLRGIPEFVPTPPLTEAQLTHLIDAEAAAEDSGWCKEHDFFWESGKTLWCSKTLGHSGEHDYSRQP